MRKFIAALCAAVMVLGSTATFVAAPSQSSPSVEMGTVATLDDKISSATSEAGTVTIKEVTDTTAVNALKAAVVEEIQERTEAVKAKVLALADVSLPEGKGGKITFKVDGVFSTDTVNTIVVLHWNGSVWEEITPDAVSAGTVTATFSSLSPVAIVKVIPEAGKFGVGFSTVALVAAAGLAGAVVCGKKKSN